MEKSENNNRLYIAKIKYKKTKKYGFFCVNS